VLQGLSNCTEPHTFSSYPEILVEFCAEGAEVISHFSVDRLLHICGTPVNKFHTTAYILDQYLVRIKLVLMSDH